MVENFAGKESEWNEGTFKSMRLHDCQNLINFYKRNLTAKSDGRFNYENWFIEVQNLRDEGDYTYDEEEIKEVDRLEKEIVSLMKDKPAHKVVQEGRMGSALNTAIFYKDNFDKICQVIRQYERTVKRYNGNHGLTTKNKDSEDDGL